MNSLLKKIGIAAAVLIILAAVFSSVFRSLTPWAKQYKVEVEQRLSTLLGHPVTIQSMETGWYWFEPVLKLQHITLRDREKQLLHLEKLLVGINLFKSLWHWRIQPGMLYLDGIRLVAREKERHWSIDGLSLKNTTQNDLNSQNSQHILAWLAQQDRLIIKNMAIAIHLADGSVIPVKDLNISVANSSGHYRLKGEAELEPANSTVFQLLGDLNFDPNHLDYTKGQIYFSAKQLAPTQWKSLFPKVIDSMQGGKGDIALWLSLNKGAVVSVQSQIAFKRLTWFTPDRKKSQTLQDFYVNLSWRPDGKGWQFRADRLKLKIGAVSWPENQLLLKFDKTQESYQFYAKSLLIESLFSLPLDWPAPIQKLLLFKPQGILTNTQLLIKAKEAQYFLTRFDHLGWIGHDAVPLVKNVSGVLHWQPEEGRLELDAENTLIGLKGHPFQNLDLLNGAIEWKTLNNDLRVSIERFVLSQPELTVTAEGALDQLKSDSVGAIRLVTEFSGKDLQQWIPFLPEKELKPKLYAWLKNDVKRIAKASGKMVINGLAKDFPFDNNNGEFSIMSQVNGVELLINSKWPIIRDIDAYIRVNKRNFDVDIVNADFQGAPAKQMNLRIDDIGKDKETLLIHGIINAPAQKMLNYVLASPLKDKLSILKMLAMKGSLLLDLQLQIPLYPENDNNLAKGDVVFNKNTILVQHQLGTFPMDDVTGKLAFNEHGVTQSTLLAMAFGYPLNINIQSVQIPQPMTTIAVDGECSVDSLKSRFKTPFLSVLQGLFSVKALFKFTDDPNDMDSINIKSSLSGLAIDLPAPLAKTRDAITPLEVNLDFKSQKTLRLRANYNALLSTDLLFTNQNGALKFQSGQLELGNTVAVDQNKPGLAIVGALEGFDLPEWKKVLERFSSEQTNHSWLHQLRVIDVKMAKLTFLNQQFDQMNVKAKILPNNDWSLNLEQKKIAADLIYHKPTNTVSGFAKYLHLDKIERANDDSALKIKPEQIPNLNLRIDNLSVGPRQIGNLTLKSHSIPEQWFLDYCRIDAPFYQFDIEGNWKQQGAVNQTKTRLKLHVRDLAKSLEQWQITPAVDAGTGDLDFRGSWRGAVYDFSLAAVYGTMYIELKNGRITHLSPETEEKLGLGKLLSILSLQTIPRRLKLDFSDLSHQGYSFDVFKGNFNISKGIMNTQDSYIDGPVAYASMKGDLDLVKKMYDLDLSISPHITASLPIVATIAGGPLAGLAAWVANKIINQSMQKISAYSYKISGPWKQPIVQQLSIVKKINKE